MASGWDMAAVSALVGAISTAVTKLLSTRSATQKAQAEMEESAQARVISSALQLTEMYETAIQRETARFKSEVVDYELRIAKLTSELDGARMALAHALQQSPLGIVVPPSLLGPVPVSPAPMQQDSQHN